MDIGLATSEAKGLATPEPPMGKGLATPEPMGKGLATPEPMGLATPEFMGLMFIGLATPDGAALTVLVQPGNDDSSRASSMGSVVTLSCAARRRFTSLTGPEDFKPKYVNKVRMTVVGSTAAQASAASVRDTDCAAVSPCAVLFSHGAAAGGVVDAANCPKSASAAIAPSSK